MSACIIGPICPHIMSPRKPWVWSRIPSPNKGPRHINHWCIIERRHRVFGGVSPVCCQRTQILHLNIFIALTIGKMREFRLGGLWIKKLVGLVCSFIQRCTANFSEPNWLRHWHPLGRCFLLHTCQTVVVRIRPPIANIFIAPYPRLTIAILSNRGSNLCAAGGVAFVIPIIALTAFNIRLQILKIINRPPMRIFIFMAFPPIRQRHIIINSDEIYFLIRPKGIKVEKVIPRSICGMVAKIFTPVRCVAKLCSGAKNSTHLLRQLTQLLNCDKNIIRTPDLGQPAQFRTDAKCRNPAGRLAQESIV